MACVVRRRGKWVADYRSPDGKRRWITRNTRKEAEAALAGVNVAIGRDEYIPPDTNKTLAHTYEHWTRLCVEGSDNRRGKPVSAGTRGFYAGLWSRYFALPAEGEPEATEARFAPRRLRSVTSAEIAEWKETLAKRVGPRTVLGALQLLDALYRHARRFGWAVTNPCESLHAPRYKANVRALTPAELSALLAQADGQTALLLKVAATTGLRASELFGVRFTDIDFQTGMVSITRQLQDGVAMALKTDKSRRRVPLSAAIVKELREHPRRFGGGLVFVAPDSADERTRAKRIKTGADPDIAMNLSNFHLRIWKPLLKTAKVERMTERGKLTFHSLRHCAATAAIASNANVQTVATLLGHASPQVTLTTYADAWAAQVEQSAEGIARVLFPENGSKTVAAGSAKAKDRA